MSSDGTWGVSVSGKEDIRLDDDLLWIVATYPDRFRLGERGLYATLKCGHDPVVVRVSDELREMLEGIGIGHEDKAVHERDGAGVGVPPT